MKYFFLSFYLFSLGLISEQSVAQKVKIESASITFGFPSKKVKGEISGFSSTSRLDAANFENSILSGSVEVATLDTNNGLRNWSLKGSRYFNAKSFPQITFKSSKIIWTGTKYLVYGDLTIKGTTRPLEILMELTNDSLKGETSLYSSDFGINIKKKREDNLVNIYINLKLIL